MSAAVGGPRSSLDKFSQFKFYFQSLTEKNVLKTKKLVSEYFNMEINAENLNGLSGYLEQTLKPEVHLRKPAEDFLKNVESQKGYAILLLTLLSPENPTDLSIKVAAAIAFKNYVKRNWKVVIKTIITTNYVLIMISTLIIASFC